MRIIAGTARGRNLETFTGRDIRPTPDRVREAVFSALSSRMGGFSSCRVLDLFAGSGALALEALSRGAQEALLVDRSPQASRLQRANIQRCGFADRAAVLTGDVLGLLPGLASKGPFNLVFLDPPYSQNLVLLALEALTGPGLLADGALICAEAADKDPVPEKIGPLVRIVHRSYGITAIHFFTFASEMGPPT